MELSPDEQRALKSIGDKIAEKRKAMKITQLHLATEVGISEKTLRDIEKGKIPNLRWITLQRIAECLKTSPAELSLETADTIKERNENDNWIRLLYLLKRLPSNKRGRAINSIIELIENLTDK